MADKTEEDEATKADEAVSMAAVLQQLTKLVALQQNQIATITNPPSYFLNPPRDAAIHPNPIDVKMDGTNYSYWCQAVEMHVRGREQMGHLTGDPAPPQKTDPEFRKWEVNDVIVKGWLINSLDPRLRSKYIRYPTARDLWNALATTYYDGSDEAQIFDLNMKVTQIKQEGRTVEEFYDELQAIWQEIDFRCPNPMETLGDIEKFNLFIQKTRVYIFLAGLEDRFDAIRAQVLQIKPFPSVEQAYGYVRHESSRQGVMIKGASTVQDSLAMVSRSYKSTGGKLVQSGYHFENQKKGNCPYCLGAKHSKEGCFKVIGYPAWWKGPRKTLVNNQGEKGKGVGALAVGENASGMTKGVWQQGAAPGGVPQLPVTQQRAATGATQQSIQQEQPGASSSLALSVSTHNSDGNTVSKGKGADQGYSHETNYWPWY